jgi:hypothetical protein
LLNQALRFVYSTEPATQHLTSSTSGQSSEVTPFAANAPPFAAILPPSSADMIARRNSIDGDLEIV